MIYYRPIIAEHGAHLLAGGWARFDRVAALARGKAPETIPASHIDPACLHALTAPRARVFTAAMDRPNVMGILNVTPDSFSDGGDYAATESAVARALDMVADGAAFIDVGGESTRPGAQEVPAATEAARVTPVIAQLAAQSDAIISLDTRKAAVFSAVSSPVLLNDVSALGFDPALAQACAARDVPVCLMHAVATPETMQAHAVYDDVLLDVYDHLAERIAFAQAAGIARDKIIIDPGIGFGKTLEHNLTLIRGLSLFHGLGCPILLGASRKRFIGTLGGAPDAKDRVGGSVAVALEGVRQGVQILRVHDTFATKQALDLFRAMSGTNTHDT